MQARLTTKPVQEVIAAIQTLDLESVKLRVMDAELGEGWTREYADSIEAAYKNYLTMLAKYPNDADQILLHEDVDEFWHTHILQTMKYAADCERVFGTFLHHNPHIGERSQDYMQTRAALMEKTRSLYQLEFGGQQAADVAWAAVGKAHESAYCEATVRVERASYCEAAVWSSKAAYCEATVQAKRTAYCEAAARPAKAAYCEATIWNSKAAYCEAAVQAKRTAYCEAVARPAKAAYCEAAIQQRKAA